MIQFTTIEFDKHKGKLNMETNEVNFYGMEFTSILTAIKYLKNVEAGPEYVLWTYRRFKGLKNPYDGWVYVDDRWLCDENFAKDYIKDKCKSARESKSHARSLGGYTAP